MSQTPDQPGPTGHDPQPESPPQPPPAPQPQAPQQPAPAQSQQPPVQQPGAGQPFPPHQAPPSQPLPPHAAGPAAGPTPPHASSASNAANAPDQRSSVWRDATSTTGGKVAVVLAGASLLLVGILTAALIAGGLAWGLRSEARESHSSSESRPGLPNRGGEGQGPGQGLPGPMNPDQQGPDQQGPDQQGPGDDGAMPELPGLPGVPNFGSPLHGEVVLSGSGSTPQTVLFQRGEVTEVTADKLTVKSTDGFSATYTIGADTRERLKNKVSTLSKGDQVTVLADKSNTTTLRILKTGSTPPS